VFIFFSASLKALAKNANINALLTAASTTSAATNHTKSGQQGGQAAYQQVL